MKYLFYLLILSMLLSQSAESLQLQVHEPRVSNVSYPGTIEDIQMTVTPHGTYMEVGVYLTISPRGSVFSSETEILPKKRTGQ